MLHIYKKAQALEQLRKLQVHNLAEQNIFYHPDFLNPALHRFATEDCGLIIFENPEAQFLLPFQIAKAGVGFKKSICGWSNIYATQGTPLMMAQAMPDTLESVMRELAKPEHNFPDTLLLHNINLNAAFAKAIHEIAQRKNLPLHITRQLKRPVLRSATSPEAYLNAAIGKNHHRDYRRLWRRLSETGTLHYRIAREKTDINKAMEDFLKLEASGWKGKAGTAFLNKHQDAEFARKAVSNLAAQGLVHIHALWLDNRPVASLIVFLTGGQAWTWKTAYNEALRAYSPGVLLMIEVIKNHLDNPALHLTDSCAIPDHPVMARLFHERESFGTMIIGLTDNSVPSVRYIARQLAIYDALLDRLRTLKSWLRKFGKS